MPENQMVRMGGQVDLSHLNPNLRVSEMHLRRSGSLDLIASPATSATAPLQLQGSAFQPVNNHRESTLHHPAARYSMYVGPAPGAASGLGGVDSDVEIIEVPNGRLMGIGGVPVARMQAPPQPQLQTVSPVAASAAGRGEWRAPTAAVAQVMPDEVSPVPVESEEEMAYRLMKMRGANESFRNAVDKAFTRPGQSGKQSVKGAREPKHNRPLTTTVFGAPQPQSQPQPQAQTQVQQQPQPVTQPLSTSAGVSVGIVSDGSLTARSHGRPRDKAAHREQERRTQSQNRTDRDAGHERRPSEGSLENAGNQQPQTNRASVALTGRLPASLTDRGAGAIALRYSTGPCALIRCQILCTFFLLFLVAGKNK